MISIRASEQYEGKRGQAGNWLSLATGRCEIDVHYDRIFCVFSKSSTIKLFFFFLNEGKRKRRPDLQGNPSKVLICLSVKHVASEHLVCQAVC